MAKRLYLVAALLAATTWVGCKSNGESGDESRIGGGGNASTLGRDAVEIALESLSQHGISGRVLRYDINSTREDPIRIGQIHLLSTLLLLETASHDPGPGVFAFARDSLGVRWVSAIRESTAFPVSENDDTVLLVSRHYVHALEIGTGLRALQHVGGALDGNRRPDPMLPFTPTGGAAAQHDTFYLPSLGSKQNNKNIESFSLVTGQRGWGYRASGDVLTTPIVGGDRGDPKLYFVTSNGLVTCLDAENYGVHPRPVRWETFLDSRVSHGIFVTRDGKDRAGGLYVVDNEGVVYCLNRITGQRRWVSATGRAPAGQPRVFGDLCVVPMKGGLAGFDSNSAVYRVEVTSGPDKGASFLVRGDAKATLGRGANASFRLADDGVAESHLTFEAREGGLGVVCSGENEVQIDGGASSGQGVALNRSEIQVGKSVLTVTDRGDEPLWADLPYERVIAKVGDKVVVANGNEITVIDASSGAPVSEAIALQNARLIGANVFDGNLYVVGGDAILYALLMK